MAVPYRPSSPDRDEVVLKIAGSDVTLSRWTSYRFSSDFLTPTDGWSFEVGDENLPEEQREALQLGARVRLSINAVPVADGYIDTIEINADRSGGQTWSISGRDRLSFAVDATADPTLSFKADATLATVLKTLFAPYGWSDDAHFSIDNDANRNASTGVRGITRRSTSKKRFGQPLASYKIHQLKPYNHEGVFAFACRVAQRQGLWIWCSNDGETLVVGKPDFAQEPTFTLRRARNGVGNNILSGAVRYDHQDQPSIIIADGFSGGGEFGKGRIKSYVVNPYFGVDEDGFVLDAVTKIIQKYPDAKQVTMTTQPFKRRTPLAPVRPMFLHDDESKTQDELDAYVRREMSLLMRKGLTVHYVVEGHGQTSNGETAIWAVDTVVDVQDEIGGVNERMYVLGVHFEKSRSGGTTTRLDLVRLNSIQFDVADETAKPAGATGNSVEEKRRERERKYHEEQLTKWR